MAGDQIACCLHAGLLGGDGGIAPAHAAAQLWQAFAQPTADEELQKQVTLQALVSMQHVTKPELHASLCRGMRKWTLDVSASILYTHVCTGLTILLA